MGAGVLPALCSSLPPPACLFGVRVSVRVSVSAAAPAPPARRKDTQRSDAHGGRRAGPGGGEWVQGPVDGGAGGGTLGFGGCELVPGLSPRAAMPRETLRL